MSNLVYFWIWLLGVTALWALWTYGYKQYFLESFQEKLFELRDDLFSMAAKGVVSFHDPAYVSMRTLINGLIYFAERLTFGGFVSAAIWHSRRAVKSGKRNQRRNEEPDFNQRLTLQISKFDVEVKAEFDRVRLETYRACVWYMLACSLSFQILVIFVFMANRFRPSPAKRAMKQPVSRMQGDVYRMAKSQNVQLCPAA